MKSKLIYGLMTVMFLGSSAVKAQNGAANNVIDEVIWVVGDEAILKSDVENSRLSAVAEGQRIEGDPY